MSLCSSVSLDPCEESQVEEMFGTEAFTKKIMRLLAKGAVAGAAASVVFLETEATKEV